jgi:hypothetical protein
MARVKLMSFKDKSLDEVAFNNLDDLYDFAESYKEFSKDVLPRSRSSLHSSTSTDSSRPISSANSGSTRSSRNDTRQGRVRSKSPMTISEPISSNDQRTGRTLSVPDQSNIKSLGNAYPRPMLNAFAVQPSTADPVIETKIIGNHTLERSAYRVAFNGHAFSGQDAASTKAFYQVLVRSANKLDSLQLALNQATEKSQDFKEIEGWDIRIRLAPHAAQPIQLARQERHINGRMYGSDGEFIWINNFKLLPRDTTIKDWNLKVVKENEQKLAMLVEQLQRLARTHGPGCTPEVVGWDMKLIIPKREA